MSSVPSEQVTFVLADQALAGVVAQIREEQWDETLPDSFMVRRLDHTPTLRELINYHAYDDAWVPDMLAGRTIDEAGRDRFDGDLLGEDPVESFSRFVAAACDAARACTDLDRRVHLSFGDYSAQHYFWQINQFRTLRAHDIAKVIGVDPALPDALVEGVWAEVSPNVEEWRAIGIFPAAVPVPDDAPLLDRLLGSTGRDPAG